MLSACMPSADSNLHTDLASKPQHPASTGNSWLSDCFLQYLDRRLAFKKVSVFGLFYALLGEYSISYVVTEVKVQALS